VGPGDRTGTRACLPLIDGVVRQIVSLWLVEMIVFGCCRIRSGC
jgi:hypothetical protein